MKKLVEDPVKGGIADGDDATLAMLGSAELDLTGAGDPVTVEEA